MDHVSSSKSRPLLPLSRYPDIWIVVSLLVWTPSCWDLWRCPVPLLRDDVRRAVREETKNTDPEFALYNRLQVRGCHGLLADNWKDDVKAPLGNPGNPG